MQRPIYLDHHATTPCDPRVVEAMAPYWSVEFGNPASRTHAFGWRAEEAVERAREQVAALIGADSREIVFTSGATESNNLAILGLARARRDRGDHLITCRTEHAAVLDPCEALERDGFHVTRLGVDREGRLDPGRVCEALEPGTIGVTIMHANNEIGVIQPIAEIAALLCERSIPLHTDAAQSVGRIPVDVAALGVDLLSLTGHKLYGPKGVGALYRRRRQPPLRLVPLQHGGGHESGLRSGTLPVPLCVGLGRACEIAQRELADEAVRVAELRDRLWRQLREHAGPVHLNGHPRQRLPGNLNVSFPGLESAALLVALPELALSAGSACTSSRPEPSHVLRALGFAPDRAASAIRVGLGRGNSRDDIDAAAALIVKQVERLRAMAPARGQPAGAARRS